MSSKNTAMNAIKNCYKNALYSATDSVETKYLEVESVVLHSPGFTSHLLIRAVYFTQLSSSGSLEVLIHPRLTRKMLHQAGTFCIRIYHRHQLGDC